MSNSNRGHLSGGEHPEGRRAMRELERDLRQSGYSGEKARRIARDTAIRHDKGQGAKKDR